MKIAASSAMSTPMMKAHTVRHPPSPFTYQISCSDCLLCMCAGACFEQHGPVDLLCRCRGRIRSCHWPDAAGVGSCWRVLVPLEGDRSSVQRPASLPVHWHIVLDCVMLEVHTRTRTRLSALVCGVHPFAHSSTARLLIPLCLLQLPAPPMLQHSLPRLEEACTSALSAVLSLQAPLQLAAHSLWRLANIMLFPPAQYGWHAISSICDQCRSETEAAAAVVKAALGAGPPHPDELAVLKQQAASSACAPIHCRHSGSRNAQQRVASRTPAKPARRHAVKKPPQKAATSKKQRAAAVIEPAEHTLLEPQPPAAREGISPMLTDPRLSQQQVLQDKAANSSLELQSAASGPAEQPLQLALEPPSLPAAAHTDVVSRPRCVMCACVC